MRASLAQIDLERLIVKGRTLAYRGTPKTAAQIGQELSVDYLVEGSIRTEGGRLRVTATLIRMHVCERAWRCGLTSSARGGPFSILLPSAQHR
jgi:TolB-like protein